jgi:hypothetical protein
MSTERKYFLVTLDEIDETADSSGAAGCAELEAEFLRMVRGHRGSCGMSQIQIVSCEVFGD